MRRNFGLALCLFLACQLVVASATFAEQPRPLSDQLSPILSCLSGDRTHFSISAKAVAKFDDDQHRVDGQFVRYDDQQFDLSVKHPEYEIRVHRRRQWTAIVLPLHKTVYVGRGAVDTNDNLAPQDAGKRLVSTGSVVSTYLPMLQAENRAAIAALAGSLLKLQHDDKADLWRGSDGLTLRFSDHGQALKVQSDEATIDLKIGKAGTPKELDWSAWNQVELTREELERQLSRGLRRTLEILAPSPMLTSPAQRPARVAGGELRWIGGQRVALLSGNPQQVGRAHGKLLRDQATRCIDSVLYAFGTVQMIRTGRWFRHDLQAAYDRLSPYIPEDHKTETRALALALDMEPQLVESLNVFPELFHCSGFALFGEATKDGKLYHGRVLDYMTTIGLQDAATTFIVAVDGKIPFANVGYAGFVGSVTGMNDRAISLGEMGGGGEGQWDGVPMATLMRRALEECSTLEEVKQLWRESPRTCEYFYVFADGKTSQAVGVAALPESIEFIQPGQSHPRLGEGIADAVVLSAGDRLATLRQRVQSRHGQIDAKVAQWLMSRPVAMQSNLHNALFIPADGIFYVAGADHGRPAAECDYVRYDLKALLQSMQQEAPVALLP